jgi:hypothetical protein
MQGPKKMAGGGIIAFAEGDSVPPADQTKIDEEEYRRLGMASMPNPRAKSAEKQAAMREAMGPGKVFGTKDTGSVPPAAKEDAKKPDENLKIQNVPDPDNGIAALMRMAGGMGGGGGGPSREESALRKQLLEGLKKQGPAQTEYIENARRVANELETARAPSLSDAERDALEEKQYGKYQARSKPHFDMMQKLIDEERAANNAGKESEVYKMLGKMGGALMSSRGAFGPALGRAVGEGIDYSDKADAARAAAERLRRSAQMDLLKARMADEKNDQKSAQDYLNERDRKLEAAFKINQDLKLGAMGLRGKMADLEAGDERSRERVLNQLAISDAKNEARAAVAGANQQNAMLRMQLGLMGLQQKREVAPLEKMKIKTAINEMFSNPFNDPDAIGYIQAVKGNRGVNLLAKIKSGELSPKDAMLDPVMAEARQIAYGDFLSGTSKSGGGSGVQSYDSYIANLPK